MSEYFILGSGGFARVMVETLRQCGTPAACYVDRGPTANLGGLEYFGNDDALLARGPAGVILVNGIGSSDLPKVRRNVFRNYKDAGFAFATVVHPSALVASDVMLGEGAQIVAGAVLQSNVKIGRNTLINVGVVVDHDSQIGDHAHLATGAVVAGAVTIGDGTMVGAGATIIQGVRIGADALVAAGATVISDVLEGGRVAGVPARPIVKKD